SKNSRPRQSALRKTGYTEKLRQVTKKKHNSVTAIENQKGSCKIAAPFFRPANQSGTGQQALFLAFLFNFRYISTFDSLLFLRFNEWQKRKSGLPHQGGQDAGNRGTKMHPGQNLSKRRYVTLPDQSTW